MTSELNAPVPAGYTEIIDQVNNKVNRLDRHSSIRNGTELPALFLEPEIKPSEVLELARVLRAAALRSRDRTSEECRLNDERLWWLGYGRRHPYWLSDEKLAILFRWVTSFQQALVDEYVGNFGRRKPREQATLAHVHADLGIVKIALGDEVYSRVERYANRVETPEAVALNRVYWDCELGGAEQAVRKWVDIRLPEGVNMPDYMRSVCLSQPTPDEWEEAGFYDDRSLWEDSWSRASFLAVATLPGTGQGAWL